MACFHPLQAYRCASGAVVFSERRAHDIVSTLWLPCGQCVGCRLERSRQWAMRCMHESTLHKRNSFITLTYDDANLPKRGCLEYSAFQLFLKRLRKGAGALRFFMCGEYGEQNWRPHYHACLFGIDFDDKKYWRTSDSGSKCYRSAALESYWPFGNSEVGNLTFESAAYVARYCVTKVNGNDILAVARYGRVDAEGFYMLPPEFAHMSLKPGIGQGWFKKFGEGVYNFDSVIVRGKEVKPPKYYDVLLGRDDPEKLEEVKFRREVDGKLRFEDNTDERLMTREEVVRARMKFFHRS